MRNELIAKTPGPWYGFATGLLLIFCGPLGLIALWFGGWSIRSKVLITVLWLVVFGPATFFYVDQMYHPNPLPSPTP